METSVTFWKILCGILAAACVSLAYAHYGQGDPGCPDVAGVHGSESKRSGAGASDRPRPPADSAEDSFPLPAPPPEKAPSEEATARRILAAANRTMADVRIREIERYTKLGDGDRERLREAFADGAHPAPLEEVLDAETIKTIREAQAESIRARERYEQDKELFVLSRAVGLSLEQEEEVRKAMAERDQLVSKLQMEEREGTPIEELHDMGRIIEIENEVQEKARAFMNERMKPLMSEAQYNKFLEYQAKLPRESMIPFPLFMD